MGKTNKNWQQLKREEKENKGENQIKMTSFSSLGNLKVTGTNN